MDQRVQYSYRLQGDGTGEGQRGLPVCVNTIGCGTQLSIACMFDMYVTFTFTLTFNIYRSSRAGRKPSEVRVES